MKNKILITAFVLALVTFVTGTVLLVTQPDSTKPSTPETTQAISGESNITTIPESNPDTTLGSDSIVDTTAAPDSDVDTTAAPDSDVDTTAAPDSDVDTTTAPDSDVDTTTAPDSDVDTTAAPDTEPDTTTTSESDPPIVPCTHTYAEQTTAATCGKDGKTTYRCSKCGDSYTEILPATGNHTYVTKVTKEATCTKTGTETTACSACGHVSSIETIPATGHSWDNGVVTTAAGCGKTGSKTFTCDACRATKIETIPATSDHTYVTKVTKEATCTKTGIKTTACSGCGHVSGTETIAATGHSWNSGAITTAATCGKDGVKTYTCSSCGTTTTERIEATGNHTEGAWVTTTSATCTSQGAKIQKCSVCDVTMHTQTIATTSHTAGSWTTITAATCTAAGTKVQKCTVCKTTLNTQTIPAEGHSNNYSTGKCDTCGTAIPYTVNTGATNRFTTTHYSNYASMSLSLAQDLPSGWAGDQYFLDGETPYTWFLSYGSAVGANEIMLMAKTLPSAADLATIGVYYSNGSAGSENWTKINCTVKKNGDYWVFVFAQPVTAKHFMLHMATPLSSVRCNWLPASFYSVYDPQGGSNDTAYTDTVTLPVVVPTPPSSFTQNTGTNKFTCIHSSNYANMTLANAQDLPSGWAGNQYFLDGETPYTWFLTYSSAVWVNEIYVKAQSEPTASEIAGVGVYYSDSNTGWTKATVTVMENGDYWVFVLSEAVQAKNFMLHMASPSSAVYANWLPASFYSAYDPQGGSNDATYTGPTSTTTPSTPSDSVPTTYTQHSGTNKFTNTHYSNYASMSLTMAQNLPSGWGGTQYFLDGSTPYTWFITYSSAKWVNEIKVYHTGITTPYASDLANVGVYYSDSNSGWTKVSCTVKQNGNYWVFVFSQAVKAKNFMLHMASPSSNIHCNWLESYFFGVYDPNGGNNDAAYTYNGSSSTVSKIKLYIDQGHNPNGYHNAGANGISSESDVNYNVGIALQTLLLNDGRFEVKLSRPTATTVLGTTNASSLSARSSAANSWGADYFISLHCNAGGGTGIEAYSYDQGEGWALGQKIVSALCSATGLPMRKSATGGMAVNTSLAVLNSTSMPAVLVEMGFVDTATDANLQNSNPGLFAQGIYNGILAYFGYTS